MSDHNKKQNAAFHDEATSNVSQANDSTTNPKDDSPFLDTNSLEASPNGATTGISELLGELRRMQKKLSEVDERTRQDSQANYAMRFITGMDDVNSIPSNGLPNPPAGSISSNMEPWKQGVLARVILPTDSIESLRKYMRFSKGRILHQYNTDIRMHAMFEDDLEIYYTNIIEKQQLKSEVLIKEESSINVRLNHIEWNEWKACAQLPETKSCVIDVLVGEPTFPDPYSTLLGRRSKTITIQGEKKTGISRESAVPGEGPLPERIRIHSSLLVKVLEAIASSHAPTRIPKPPEDLGIVMVRPFKFLVFYQNQIQEWYDRAQEELNASVGDSTSQAPETRGSIPSGTEATGIQTNEDVSGVHIIASDAPETRSNGAAEFELRKERSSIAVQDKDRKLDPLRSEAASAHVRCLLEFLHTEISSKQKYLGQDCKKVSFVELWYLFKPGTEVIEAGDKHMQCYRVVKVTSPRHKVAGKYSWFFRNKVKGGTAVSIDCVYVDFDGRVVGPVSKKFDITRYEGLRDIKTLPVYPLRFEGEGDNLRQRLVDRGKKFLRVMQVGHMHYSGLTLESRDEIDSQVVIDFMEALATREDHKDNGWKPNVQVRARAEDEKEKARKDRDSDSDSDSDSDDEETACDGECCYGEIIYDDNFVDARQNEQYISGLLENTEEDNPAPLAVLARTLQKGKEMHVTDDDLVIMSYRVFGFVLRSRSWAKLDLTELMDLDEYRRRQEMENPTGGNKSENAFDNLVFPKDGLDRKKIVRSLVAQHFRDRESATSREEQRDIVRGKGKGLIILLHGAPGVGKTTTAEGIAEIFNKPLFQITCGDLGTTAKEVEAALERNFSLANKWGSILLLDEADVFLARRTPHDFQRNGLVAVFLRVLEYYAGILFLTTNRIGDFDEAFSSRIHISLHYPALDYNSTVDVFDLNWRLMKARFRHKGRALEIEESKITASLAEYWHKHPDSRWNGRQIRNACQTALALAEFEAQTSGDDGAVTNPFAKVHLGVSHMKTVSDAYLEFIKYLQDVRDADQERYAFLMGIRRQEGKDMSPENPLAYRPSSPLHRGQVNRLAEHRAKSAARYNRPEQGLYPPSTSYTNIGGDQLGNRPGSSVGGVTGSSPYPHFSRQTLGVGMGPYQHPLPESLPQRGWNPGPVGGYYAGTQETQFQQGPPAGAEGFPSSHPYEQHPQT